MVSDADFCAGAITGSIVVGYIAPIVLSYCNIPVDQSAIYCIVAALVLYGVGVIIRCDGL